MKIHNWNIQSPGKMKYPVYVAVLYAVALSLSTTLAFEVPPEMKEIVDAAHSACTEETGVGHEVLAQAMKGVMVDDPKLKCFMKCVLQRLQAMRDDGSLDLDLVEASMPAELKEHGAMESLKKCMNQSDKDLCKVAFNILKCVKEENPKVAEFFN